MVQTTWFKHGPNMIQITWFKTMFEYHGSNMVQITWFKTMFKYHGSNMVPLTWCQTIFHGLKPCSNIMVQTWFKHGSNMAQTWVYQPCLHKMARKCVHKPNMAQTWLKTNKTWLKLDFATTWL